MNGAGEGDGDRVNFPKVFGKKTFPFFGSNICGVYDAHGMLS